MPAQEPSPAPSLTCVVCGTSVAPADPVCPTCSEPRVRICRCSTLVDLGTRQCPTCGVVLPRVISLALRSKRRWKRRMTWIAIGTVAVAGAAVVFLPRFRDSRRVAALREEGAAAMGARRWEDARRSYESLLAIRRTDADAMAQVALACFASGDGDGGVAWAQRALAVAPASPGLHLAMSRHHLAAGDPHLALSHARAAAEPESAVVAARALTALGRFVEAATEFEKALRLVPDDLALRLDAAEAHARLGESEWVEAPEHRTRAAEILAGVASSAKERLATSPGDADALRALAFALARDARVPVADADAACRRAVAAAPDAVLRADWARALLRGGRGASVAEALGPVGSGMSPEQQIERARLLVSGAGFEAAERELREMLASLPSDTSAAAALARILIDAGRHDEALAAIGAARAAGSTGIAVLFEVAGDAAAARGDLGLAERHYVTWRDADPHDPRPLRKLLDLRMVELLRRRRGGFEADERVRAATARMEDLGAIDSEDRTLLAWKAQWDDLNDRRAEATAALAKLAEQHPEDGTVRALVATRTLAVGDDAQVAALVAQMADPARSTPGDVEQFALAAVASGRIAPLLDVRAARGRTSDVAEDCAVRALLAAGLPGPAAELVPAPATAAAVTAHAMAGRADDARRAVAAATTPSARISLARALAAGGLADDARVALRAVASERLGTDDLVAVAAALDEVDDVEGARIAWAAAERSAPDDLTLLVRSSVAAMLRTLPDDDDRAAAAARTELARTRPEGSIAALALRGAFALAEGDPVVAARDLRRAVAALPDRTDLRRALARAMLRSGDALGAAQNAREILLLDPADAIARRLAEDAGAAIAASAIARGRLADALDAADDAVRANGRSGPAMTTLPRFPAPLSAGTASRLRARSLDDPRDAGARLVLALDAAANGKLDAAATLATEVSEGRTELAAGPAVRALVRRAAGDEVEIADDVAAAVGRGLPSDDAALLAALLAKPAPATADADRVRAAVAARPESARLAATLVGALRASGDDAGALTAATAFLARHPEAALREDLHALGAALHAASKTADASRVLRLALLVAPRAPAAATSRTLLAR